MIELTAETRASGRSVLALLDGDITRVAAEAIVKVIAGEFGLRNGGGVDGAHPAAAGLELSGEMRCRFPAGIPTGTDGRVDR